MKVLLDIKDEKGAFIMELLKNFNFVKAETISPQKAEFIQDMKEAVDEVKQIKAGKSKGISANDLLNEL